jgi:putative nucleotidyltransferase with HDIG domain
LAFIRHNQLVEMSGSLELFRSCGLVNATDPAFPSACSLQPGAAVRTEKYCGEGGTVYYADRYVIAPAGHAADAEVAEILYDVSDRVRAAGERESEYVKILKILVNMFEIRDPYSQGHSEVVGILSQELAKALALPGREVEIITKAAMLHDIGKIVIPPEILNKRDVLLPGEYEVVKAHSGVGADILASMDIFRDVVPLVRHHHERFDGQGYPAGLVGRDIPLGARILAVADAFEAMTAGRSVKGKQSVDTALAILADEGGGQFDPDLVEVFIRLVRAGRTG